MKKVFILLMVVVFTTFLLAGCVDKPKATTKPKPNVYLDSLACEMANQFDVNVMKIEKIDIGGDGCLQSYILGSVTSLDSMAEYDVCLAIHFLEGYDDSFTVSLKRGDRRGSLSIWYIFRSAVTEGKTREKGVLNISGPYHSNVPNQKSYWDQTALDVYFRVREWYRMLPQKLADIEEAAKVKADSLEAIKEAE